MLPLMIAALSAVTIPDVVDRTIDVDGVAIHVRCAGERREGQPLVILEAGGFNSADTWRDVHAPIAEFARVCAYDRPGRGSSPALKNSVAADEYIGLIKRLLQAAGEKPPYVIAGHSLGGVLAMLYAGTYPAEVAGLVLVDSSHEDQVRRFRAAPPLKPTGAPPTPPPSLTPEVVPFPALADALAKNPWRGEIPLVVLSRGRAPQGDDPSIAAREAIWFDLHRDFLTRSPKSEHVIAKNSGHYIHNDEPRLVIDAVRRVVDASSRRAVQDAAPRHAAVPVVVFEAGFRSPLEARLAVPDEVASSNRRGE